MVYVPSLPPTVQSLDELLTYLQKELQAISQEGQETTAIDLRPVYREPTNPRAGMLVYADGTTWNPGSGEGVYTYTSGGTWSKL